MYIIVVIVSYYVAEKINEKNCNISNQYMDCMSEVIWIVIETCGILYAFTKYLLAAFFLLLFGDRI